MSKGTRLEHKFQGWCKKLDIYCHRFYDSKSFGKMIMQQPADFFVYHKSQLFFIELKHTESTSLPFGNIANNQLRASLKAENHSIVYLFMIEIKGSIFAVKSCQIRDFIANDTRKSIPYKWFLENGIEVKNLEKMLNSFIKELNFEKNKAK